MRLIGIATAVAALVVALATPALAGKGGNGNRSDPGKCVVSGTVVAANGLPTDEVVNFMVTDGSGTWGWVLGYTWDGTFAVTVPAPSGPTTYEFASRTWGPHGTKYAVFASCSA